MELSHTRVLDIGVTQVCNFSCDYCIASSNTTSSVSLLKSDDDSVLIAPASLRSAPLAIRRKNGVPTGYIDYINWLKKSSHGHPRDWFIDLPLLTKFLRRHATEWIIGISGGEPLRYPLIDKWLIDLSITHKIILLTNLSLIESNKSILEIPSDRMFYRVGFHPEQRTISRFLHHLSYLRDANKSYIVNYILHPRHIKDGTYASYLDMFVQEGINYEVTRFEGSYGGVDYDHKHPLTDEEAMIITEPRYIEPPMIDGSIVGRSYAIMQGNGRIYECNEKSLNIGNLYQDWFNPQTVEHKSCFVDGCVCSPLTAIDNIFKSHWH